MAILSDFCSQKRLQLLRSREAGRRCVLVANGPSLNRMNLGFLKKETVFGLNKIFLGIQQLYVYPRYYVAVNKRVIEQSVEQIKAMTSVKFIGCRGEEMIKEDALTYHIQTLNPPYRFCHDIVDGVHEGWTVTYAALQIAFYLGFKEVVIIGMDHRYKCKGAPNEAHILDGPDPNHFHPDYFGGGQIWDNPDLPNSEESYQIAREEYEKDGRNIVDATLDGACTVFKKADYRDIFGLGK